MIKKLFFLCLLLLAGLLVYIGYFKLSLVSVELTTGKFPEIFSEEKLILWQTNFSDSTIHVVDVATQELIKEIELDAEPHGVAYLKEKNRIYLSLEHESRDRGEVIMMDAGTYQILAKVQVGPAPHELEITEQGEFIYVPCGDEHYWVIDGYTNEVVKRIHTGGRPHNTRLSHDGKRMFLSPMGPRSSVFVVDVFNDHRIIDTILFSGSVRPPTLSQDGRWFIQHVDQLNGFEVADLNINEMVLRKEHRDDIGYFFYERFNGWVSERGVSRCHGIEINEKQKEVWSVCGDYLRIHTLGGNFEETHSFDMKAEAYWITFSPHGKYAFIALIQTATVLIVDTETKDLLYELKVGNHPKRNVSFYTDL